VAAIKSDMELALEAALVEDASGFGHYAVSGFPALVISFVR